MNVFENVEKEIADIVESKKPLLFRNKRRDAYNVPPDRLLHVYQNYFTDFPDTGNYTFNSQKMTKMICYFFFVFTLKCLLNLMIA